MSFTPSATVHLTQQVENRRTWDTIVALRDIGALTASILGSKTSYSALKTAMLAVSLNGPDSVGRARLIRFLDQANAVGFLTDAQITAAGAAASADRFDVLYAYYLSVESPELQVNAQVTLISDGTAPSNNDTVTIGTHVYTYKTVLTGVADEVLIGANAAAALTNLKAAINGAAGAGATYGTGTVAHTQVQATTLTATTLLIVALTAGTAGNAIASTETSSHLSFGSATLLGGASNPVRSGHPFPRE